MNFWSLSTAVCSVNIFYLFDSAHDQCACLVRCRPYWTPRFLSSKCDAVPSWYLVEGFRVTKSRGGGSAGSVGRSFARTDGPV